LLARRFSEQGAVMDAAQAMQGFTGLSNAACIAQVEGDFGLHLAEDFTARCEAAFASAAGWN